MGIILFLFSLAACVLGARSMFFFVMNSSGKRQGHLNEHPRAAGLHFLSMCLFGVLVVTNGIWRDYHKAGATNWFDWPLTITGAICVGGIFYVTYQTRDVRTVDLWGMLVKQANSSWDDVRGLISAMPRQRNAATGDLGPVIDDYATPGAGTFARTNPSEMSVDFVHDTKVEGLVRKTTYYTLAFRAQLTNEQLAIIKSRKLGHYKLMDRPVPSNMPKVGPGDEICKLRVSDVVRSSSTPDVYVFSTPRDAKLYEQEVIVALKTLKAALADNADLGESGTVVI